MWFDHILPFPQHLADPVLLLLYPSSFVPLIFMPIKSNLCWCGYVWRCGFHCNMVNLPWATLLKLTFLAANHCQWFLSQEWDFIPTSPLHTAMCIVLDLHRSCELLCVAALPCPEDTISLWSSTPSHSFRPLFLNDS